MFNKKIIVILLLSCFTLICLGQKAGEIIDVPAQTPCWNKPFIQGPPIFIFSQQAQVKATGKNQYFIIKRGSLYSKVLLNQFILGDKTLWLCQYIYVNTDPSDRSGRRLIIIPDRRLPDTIYAISIIALALLLLGWLKLYRNDFKSETWTKYKYLWMLAFLLLLHYAWIGYFISHTAEWGHLPQDEQMFFDDITGFFQNGFRHSFKCSLGISVYYLPYIMVFKPQNMYDIAPIISWVMVLVIAPATFIFIYLFIRKLTESDWTAFVTVMLLLLLPKIYLAAEQLECSIFGPYFLNPESYIFTCYQQILTGFNSMRDFPSTFLVFGLLATALIMRTPWRYVILSIFFAFCCHMRMNNIFFAPLLAYIFWRNDKRLVNDIPYTLKMAGFAIVTFLLFYSPQFAVNWYHYGGPLRSAGYGHIRGFEFASVPMLSKYLMNIHYLYFGVFIVSCIVIRDSYKRNIIVLLVVPMTIFFSGLHLTAGQPYRYLLSIFPGTIAALVIAVNELRNRANNQKQLYLLAGLLVILAYPILPVYGLKPDIYQQSTIADVKRYIAPIACLAVIFWYWKAREKALVTASVVLSFFFLCSSAWIMFSSLVILLAWTSYSWLMEMIKVAKQARQKS